MPPVKHDPAPSRLSYRLQRLWLTPWIRRVVRYGPPLFLVAGLTLHAVTDARLREMVAGRIDAARTSVEERDAFRVTHYKITGASTGLRTVVAGAAGVALPISSLKIDVNAMRERVMALPRVRAASVRVAKGGALEIDVTERLPAALWREGGQLKILDTEGVRLGATAARVDHPDLPLILGRGAENAVGEALALFQSAEAIRDRIRGMRRIGTRRWQIVLDRDQTIELPEEEPMAALQRVLGLDAVDDLLARDISIVDMRNPARPILRVGPYALSELRRRQREEKDQTQ